MLAPGATLGPYQIEELLGRGGMGAVYRARHRESGAVHALKVVAPGADPEALLRCRQEAEAMARVEGHPHLLRVHAAGQERGLVWIALQLAAGGSLEARLRAGPLPPARAAALVAQLARALAHVHARGVLHRDLKPANVLFDEADRPLLADFGLARLHDAATITRSGAVLGTPAYMAPEQARGVNRACDEQTDVYGLGAVLYHALTGQPPFPGPASFELLARVIREAPRPPRSLVPTIPPWLEAACLQALEKDPARRQPGASALAAALVEPAPEGRRPSAWLLVGGAVVVAALGLGVRAALRAELDEPPPRPGATPASADPDDDVPTDRAALLAAVGTRLAADDLPGARSLVEAAADPDLVEAGVEAAFARNDAPAALRWARLQRDPGRAGWIAARAHLLGGDLEAAAAFAERADVVAATDGLAPGLLALERARAEVARTAALCERLDRGEVWVGEGESPYAPFGQALLALEQADPARVYPGAGAAGRLLAIRMLEGLAGLERLLWRLTDPGKTHTAALAPDVVSRALEAAAAAAPDSEEEAAVRFSVLWVQWRVRTEIGEEGTLVRTSYDRGLRLGFEALLERPLAPRRRAAAQAALHGLKPQRERTRVGTLTAAEEVLATVLPAEDPLARVLHEHRETLVNDHLALAWAAPALRREAARRALALCQPDPGESGSRVERLAAARLRALVLAGEPIAAGDLDRLGPSLERDYFAAEQALLEGRLAEAEASLRALRGAERAPLDAWTALALTLAVAGDLEAGREALEAARSSGRPGLTPWRSVEATEQALTAVEHGWRPAPGEAFPPGAR